MIKIIGVLKDKTVICTECQSIIEYEDSDTAFHEMCVNYWANYFQCPECKNTIIINIV
jgi:predicted RNA-binding Zn-ribbon protein involved in translation (DUF1610 family)